MNIGFSLGASDIEKLCPLKVSRPEWIRFSMCSKTAVILPVLKE